MIALAVAALALQTDADLASEAAYYTVDHLPTPPGALLEVGGMDFLPDGRLAVSTRRGQVWIVEDALAEDPDAARFQLFCEGLWEGLGLKVIDGEIVVLQRQELSRLLDTDGDGVCDRVETISQDFGVTDNYHEFAYGLPRDDDGNLYATFNVSFYSPKWWHGKSPVPWRGWAARFAPDGAVEPIASGLRSPCGVGLGADGELYVTDNQGDWMPASPIFHVVEGGFYGHPASLDWTPEYVATRTKASDTIPPPRAAGDRRPAAVWIPYEWSRSPGNLVPDSTGGRFGPFGDQLFVAELTNGMVLRADLERVRGEVQGAVWPFRRGVGSAVRVLFAPDGTLLAGLTNRGWGGQPPSSGIARVRWTGETPMEMERVRLVPGGFEIDFTLPLSGEVAPEDARVEQYRYDYWWEYGSPEREREEVAVESVALSPDRRTLRLDVPALRPARMARIRLEGVTADGGKPLLHPEVAYCVNQLADGPLTREHVAKLVPPPPARESGWEGWLFLTWKDPTDLWREPEARGWSVADVELDEDDRTRFATSEGDGAVVNDGETPGDLESEVVLGDAKLHVDFVLPEGGESAVYVQGLYGILLADRAGDGAPEAGATGTVLGATAEEDAAPLFHAYRGPGSWHSLDVDFRAPRFDADGRKVEDARFLRVRIDDVLLHEDVALSGPSRGRGGEEAELGPIAVAGDRGLVAVRDVRANPQGVVEDESGWVALPLEDEDGAVLPGWTETGEAVWELDDDDAIVGSGPMGHLFSPRGDYRDLEVRARVKISDGGNSGLYVRAAPTEGWPEGYEAQVNSTYTDPQRTGSLYGLAPVAAQLVPADTWFDYRVRCADEEEGTRVTILVNGVVVADHVDLERRHAAGHVALQQHHEGSTVEVRDLEVRELGR